MQKLDYLAIGSRIRKQREFLGYTRDDMAEQLSVSKNFCRDVEIGAKGMSVQTLYNFSKTLKLSIDYILNGEQNVDNIEPLINMLKSCKPEKLKYAEDILKAYLLSLD